MGLFTISFLLVFISSYFLTTILKPKTISLNIIYLFTITFAQIVLIFEFLSLFSGINQKNVLFANLFIISLVSYIWTKNGRPSLEFNINNLKNSIINSLKLDKSLMWLASGFCIFILISLFLCFIMPANDGDALAYHVVRCLYWIQQGNLNHFVTADVRNLCLPINSEILYTWILLFAKKDIFLGLFSFCAYLITVISTYNILGLCGYCIRKRLWVIFILSSFPSILAQVSSTQTDLIIASLITSSIFLFWYAIKHNEKTPLYIASLAYALAVGTKTPAIIMFPAICFLFVGISFNHKKYKFIWLFINFFLINFIIFASYNYILNFLDFSNFISVDSYIQVNKNYYGIKGALANFIKHLFSFIDFAGIKPAIIIYPYIESLKMSVLNLFGLGNIPDALDTISKTEQVYILERSIGAGILGFLLYLPCIIASLIKTASNRHKYRILALFGTAFLINLFALSYSINYSTYDARYITSFIIVSSPVLIYSYCLKGKLKNIIVAVVLWSFLLISTHLYLRPFFKILNLLIKHPSIEYFREAASCKNFTDGERYTDSVCFLRNQINKNISPKNNILAFFNAGDSIYFIKSLCFDGYKIDLDLMEKGNSIDYSKYNVLILEDNMQSSNFIKNNKNRKNDYKLVNNKLIRNKNSEIACLYISNRQKIEKNITSAFVQCDVDQNFLIKNNFSIISKIVFLNPITKVWTHYDIYRNNNLPLYLNNHL